MSHIDTLGRRAVLEKAIVLLLREGWGPDAAIWNGHHCDVCGWDHWQGAVGGSKQGEHAPDCDGRATFDALIELAGIDDAALSVLENRAAMVCSTRRL